MEHFSLKKRSIPVSGWVAFLFLMGLLVFHGRITPAPHLEDLDSGGTLDALYALALAALVLFLAAGLGRLLLKPFKLTEWSFLERTVISLPLGLAAIGYGEFLLGLLGGLKPLHQVLYLIVIACIALRESTRFVREACASVKTIRQSWLEFTLLQKVFAAAGALALLFTFLQTLTPPWDYDGLMYHLQGPRLFLEAGRILPLPENWFTYYPSTWEMVYMLGMGLGSDIFARLIHFTTLIVLLASTFLFGRKWLPGKGGWLAVALLIPNPLLFMWGSFAIIDVGWSLFQFLAAALTLQWMQERKVTLLLLAGVMQGLALGCKYPSLANAGILALVVLSLSLHDQPKEGKFRQLALNVGSFGLAAFFIALPWYLKNYLWTGNPVFPYYLPQNVADPLQLELFMGYLDSFGVGRQWYNYLLLPINIYLKFIYFGTSMATTNMPNPLYLVIFAYPFVRKKLHSGRKVLDLLAIITLAFFAAWATGSQQTRFLMPLLPAASILSSAILQQITREGSGKRIRKLLVTGLVGGLVIATTVVIGKIFFLVKPYMVTTGTISKNAFLSSILFDFDGIQFINQHLPDGSKVLMPWDGKGYYCESGKCFAEMDQHYWTTQVTRYGNPDELLAFLKENGFTHIMVSLEDSAYFVQGHDFQGYYKKAYDALREITSHHSRQIFHNENLEIFFIDFPCSFSKECLNENN